MTMRRQGFVTVGFSFQRANKMLDRAPVGVEASPYKSTGIKESMGYSVGDVATTEITDGNETSLEAIRRWQRNRLQTKASVGTAQHISGVAERLRITGSSQQATDEMRDRATREAEQRRLQEYEDFKFLEQVRKEREGDSDANRIFRKKSDVKDVDVRYFPTRLMEAEREHFERTREKELAVAMGTPQAPGLKDEMEVTSVGNLTVTSMRNVSSASTHPAPYKPLRPSRLLIKQLVPKVPAGHPYVDVPADGEGNLPIFRESSTGGAIVTTSTPPTSHIVTKHEISQRVADLLDSKEPLTIEMVKGIVKEDEDLLLASHAHYAGESDDAKAFRHPSAVNLNMKTSTARSVPAKPLLQAAMEGDELPTLQVKTEDTSKMTKLEYQRYVDVMETQRQADIASAFSKAKAYEKEHLSGASGGKGAHLHKKFTHKNDPELKAQHEYLSKLLASGGPSSDDEGIASGAGNNGVQWIGTTPQMFTNKLHSFFVRVLGSSVFLGAVLYLNPSLLEPPPPPEYNPPQPAPLF